MANYVIRENIIRILNFDESVLRQKNLLEWFSKSNLDLQIVDLSDKGPYLRYWASYKDISLLKNALHNTPKEAITLYGSGDFHHLSVALIEQFTQPISIIVFDHHPDWDSFSTRISCGSWVSHIAKQENIKKVLLLGASSDDLSGFGLMSASLNNINSGKLEIYPYKCKPSRLFLRNLKSTPSLNVSRQVFSSVVNWHNLADKKNSVFLRNVLDRIPTKDVYVSIDKDCLKSDYAITNWEEGNLELNWLLEALSIIKNTKNIVGMDITGEYSKIKIKSGLKTFFSKLDHPPQPDIADADAVNEKTNLSILKLFIK